MSSRLLSRGLSDGDAIGLLTRGLIRRNLAIDRKKLFGRCVIVGKARGAIWVVK